MDLFSRSRRLLLLLAILSPAGSLAAGWTAKGYEIGQEGGTVIFTVDRTIAADGVSTRTVFTSPEGGVLVREKLDADASGAAVKYAVEHLQSSTSGVIEVKGSKLVFSYTGADGKVKTNEEDLPETWATGPTVIPLVTKNWEKIRKGESVKFRFASWERAETVGFEIFQKGVEKAADGREVVVLKMKPSSFFIAALVKPLRFEMKPDGTFLEAMTGRTLPKRADGDRFKDLDARILYTAK